ncbi:MAG: putative type modification enzyme [Blastococcus sp.]|nr:putative type modification enzyme [Blastococcus sp.]
MTPEQTIVRTVINRVAASRGLMAPWPEADVELPAWLAGADVAGWGVEELGSARERLLTGEERDSGGVWYTPLPVAESMVELAVVPQLDRMSDHPDPGNVLQVLAMDPACGAGVFLVAAARRIAARYATRMAAHVGGEPTVALARWVMPEVLSECIFGLDVDPAAVDLARSVLWLETGGTVPITFMDRNVICGNPLQGDSPPRLEERIREPG